MSIDRLVVFNDQQIRRTLHNDEWWFAVADVVTVLTGTSNATDYIKKIRSRVQDQDDNKTTLMISSLVGKTELYDGHLEREDVLDVK